MRSHAIPLMITRYLLSLHALLLVAVSLLLLSPSAPALASTLPAFAFVTDRGSGYIQIFRIFDSPGHPSHGALVPQGSKQMPLGMFPLTIKLSHSGRFAFVLTDGSYGFHVKPHILTYAVNPTTGGLTLQGMVQITLPTGGLAISRSDQFLYLTSAGASADLPGVAYHAISWFAIDPQVGTLRRVGTVDVGTRPVNLMCDSTGQFLYVTLELSNTVGMFRLDATTGKPIPLYPATMKTGIRPLSMALSPHQPLLYVGNINHGVNGTVSMYQIERNGLLTSLGEAVVGSFPGAMQVAPSGKALYVANATSNQLMVYTIGSSGKLNWLQTVPTQKQPGEMAFDPSGKALYVVDFLANVVQMFTILPSGELHTLGKGVVNAGPRPNSIATTP